jgi:predicted 2-oxoglutarate/Fe(II)-dependent dioxygenase YbiX/peroxiredoxin
MTLKSMTSANLPPLPGDYAPWFEAAALSGSPNYSFNTVGGRHILLCFFGSAGLEVAAEALSHVQRNRDLFDDRRACFFGVTIDQADAETGRIASQLPGIRFFLDYERKVSMLYGAAKEGQYRPYWLLLDKQLRVLGKFGIADGEQAITALKEQVLHDAPEEWAPVITVPQVFEPQLCHTLIDHYERHGGYESGFMRDVSGKTVGIIDAAMKRRKDCEIAEGELRQSINARLIRRLKPAIKRAFQFEATRIERYIVACYEAKAGHFRPHRDNTTLGTAHRRFAVTINLNAGDYEGGDLRFPEFGERTYRAPTGGAIVFSCSLLHEARPVTKGRRYAFLPFLYDDQAAKIRAENSRFLANASEPGSVPSAVATKA